MDGKAVRVSLSSGEAFFVDADIDDVRRRFNHRALVPVGSRWVNSTQVCQLTIDRVPSIETAERLSEEE